MPVDRLLAFSADRPLPLPVNTPVLAVMLAAVIFPLTPRAVSVPTPVILGCEAVVSVPVNRLAPTVPELA